MNCKYNEKILFLDSKLNTNCGTIGVNNNLQSFNSYLKYKFNNFKNVILDLKNINKTLRIVFILIIILLGVIGKCIFLNNNQEGKPTISNMGVIFSGKNLENIVSNKKIIIFPDKSLEKIIRLAIKKPHGDILSGDVAKITKIDASNANITNLSGIQNLTNLTVLYLYNNKISDIDNLKELTNLTVLDLYNNKINNINALERLTKLTTLYLWDNKISDINALKELTNLTVLDLWDNKISDINGLKGLTNLTVLDLSDNKIKNIDALKGFTKLEVLYLGTNQITDYAITSSFYKNLEDTDYILP